MSTLITYKIVSDTDGKLKSAAKLACAFWNKYVLAQSSIVIRLGEFTSLGNTIARAYKPYNQGNMVYGRIEFNTKFLQTFSESEIVGTIIHEIGHTLGFGWDRWMKLFDTNTGDFYQKYVDMLPELSDMEVETDYGEGTTLSHWDEKTHGAELMTGFKNEAEFVLPITIDVTSLLGHVVAERLTEKSSLVGIIDDLRGIQFTRVNEAKQLDRDFFKQTEIWEEIYTDKRAPIRPNKT